jgi:enoyl-CoA hydratase/carnithine racemase
VAEARFERHGDVGVVVVESPPLNLYTPALHGDLASALDEAEREPIRALVLRAAGEVFTGGVDVHEFEGRTPDEANETFFALVGLVHRLEELPIPAISSVHGLCLTWGLELSLGCDMIWAAESARFGLVEIVVGLTPAAGGTQRIAERAGPARARELVMTGALYDAAALERWNVVNRVVPDAELRESTMRFAERLAAGPTLANGATKRMVRAYLEGGVRAADERIGAIAGPLFETADLKRAVASFLREGPGKATFEGR